MVIVVHGDCMSIEGSPLPTAPCSGYAATHGTLVSRSRPSCKVRQLASVRARRKRPVERLEERNG